MQPALPMEGGRGIAVGNGKKGLRGFGTPCIHFRTPRGNVSGVWHWQNGGKNRNTGHDSLALRSSGIRYSHTRQEPSAPRKGVPALFAEVVPLAASRRERARYSTN